MPLSHVPLLSFLILLVYPCVACTCNSFSAVFLSPFFVWIQVICLLVLFECVIPVFWAVHGQMVLGSVCCIYGI